MILRRERLPRFISFTDWKVFTVEIVQALTHQLVTADNRDFNLENFEARETSAGDWVGAAQTLSFMGGSKLLIVRNLHETTLEDSDQKTLLNYVADPAPDSCLVITADKVDRSENFIKLSPLTKEPYLAKRLRKRG